MHPSIFFNHDALVKPGMICAGLNDAQMHDSTNLMYFLSQCLCTCS